MANSKWRNAVPSIIVAVLIVTALTLVAVSRFRRGASALSVALLLTAAFRLFLPEERLGPLAVRSRTFDVLFCGGLGGVMLWLVLIE